MQKTWAHHQPIMSVLLGHTAYLKQLVRVHPGGSAFAGYQAFSPTGPAHQLTSLVHQHSAPVPRGEEDAVDEDVQVNNRVAGGAGKRLSLEDLQVCSLSSTNAAHATGSKPCIVSKAFVLQNFHHFCFSFLFCWSDAAIEAKRILPTSFCVCQQASKLQNPNSCFAC